MLYIDMVHFFFLSSSSSSRRIRAGKSFLSRKNERYLFSSSHAAPSYGRVHSPPLNIGGFHSFSVNARFTALALMILLLLLLLLLLLPLLVSYQSLLLLGLFFFFLLTGQEVTGQPLRGGHERAFSALHGLNKPVRKPAKNGHLGQVLRVPQNRVRDVGYYHFSRLLLYVRALCADVHSHFLGAWV